MKDLKKILKQDKSDKAVIMEALEAGFTGPQIRKALMKLYTRDYPDITAAGKFYESVTDTIDIDFFYRINQGNKSLKKR